MPKKFGEYIIGDTIGGKSIHKIIGQTDNIVLGVSDNGTIVYLLQDETKISKCSQKTLKLRELLDLIPADADKKITSRIKQDIGYAFFSSCSCDGSIRVSDHFNSTEERVNNLISHTREQRYNNLVLYNILQSIFVCLIIFTISRFVTETEEKSMLLFMGGGVLGACLSLLQRNNKLDLSSFSSKKHLALSSFLTVTLGLLVGFVVFWVTRTKVYSSTINGDESLAFLLSIISGTSERTFNSLIKKIRV